MSEPKIPEEIERPEFLEDNTSWYLSFDPYEQDSNGVDALRDDILTEYIRPMVGEIIRLRKRIEELEA